METKLDYIVKHSLPGRLRVALPDLISNRAMAGRLKERLSNVSGVIRVTTNHFCGSVTIYYDTETMEKRTFLDMLARHVELKKLTPPEEGFLKHEKQKAVRHLPVKGRKRKGIQKLCAVGGRPSISN
ncbi:MAG: hypothetical protein ISS66_17225 [Desulfobacteraceae bacterium]|nr:hypothetical protein [Desulfobacteraceae bacterium]